MDTKEIKNGLNTLVAAMRAKGLIQCRAYVGMAVGKDGYGPFVSIQCAQIINPQEDELMNNQRTFSGTDFAHGIAQALAWIAAYEAPKAEAAE